MESKSSGVCDLTSRLGLLLNVTCRADVKVTLRFEEALPLGHAWLHMTYSGEMGKEACDVARCQPSRGH